MNYSYIHNETGDEYWIVERIKFRLPLIGAWIGLIKYKADNSDCFYYRLQYDFDKKFSISKTSFSIHIK